MAEPTSRGAKTIAAISAIMRDPDLAPELKVLWCLYRSYDSRGKGSWPGDDTLAQHMAKSVRSVQGYRAELLRLGYLEQQKRGPRPAIYRAVIPDAIEPPHRNGGSPWQRYGVDSPEEVVLALEQIIRVHDKDGSDEVPSEMWDTWSEVVHELAWPPIADLLKHANKSGLRGRNHAWTAIRHELHKQLPHIARRLKLNAMDAE